MTKKYRWLGILGAVIVPGLAVAALELPHVFKAGQVIKAAEVNANFEALRAEIDDLKEATKPQEAVDLELEDTVVANGGKFSLAQSSRLVGSWGAIVGDELPFPRPGLYAVDVSLYLKNGSTADPAGTVVRLRSGEVVNMLMSGTRWSANTDHGFRINARGFLRVAEGDDFSIENASASSTTEATGHVYIQRLGD